MVRDGRGVKHVAERGSAVAECGLELEDDWRRLPGEFDVRACTCGACLGRLIEQAVESAERSRRGVP